MARRKKENRILNTLSGLLVVALVLAGGYYHEDVMGFFRSFHLPSLSGDTPAFQTQQASANAAPHAEEGIFLIHFIDVGQGDSILLQSLQSSQVMENILIDGGDSDRGETVVNYLKQQCVEKLDAVIATYPASDHIGGLPKVFEEFEVGSVYMPKKTYMSKAFEDLVTAVQKEGLQAQATHSGMTIPLIGTDIQVWGPVPEENYGNLNDYSLVLMVQVQGKRFLLTGDAGTISEQEQLEQGYWMEADVLKVPYHGGTDACGDYYTSIVSPDYAVISVGEGQEEFPAPETMDTLRKYSGKILRTDRDGSVVFRVSNGVLTLAEEYK